MLWMQLSWGQTKIKVTIVEDPKIVGYLSRDKNDATVDLHLFPVEITKLWAATEV